MPDILFIVDVDHEDIAVREARKLGIPVVAIVDTNCSPEGIDYVIPGNDDAMRAIELYAAMIADAVLDGKASLPEVALGDDEFVELDAEGNVKKSSGRRKKKSGKKATVKRKAPLKIETAAAEKPEVKAEVAADAVVEETKAEVAADAVVEETKAEVAADAVVGETKTEEAAADRKSVA